MNALFYSPGPPLGFVLLQEKRSPCVQFAAWNFQEAPPLTAHVRPETTRLILRTMTKTQPVSLFSFSCLGCRAIDTGTAFRNRARDCRSGIELLTNAPQLSTKGLHAEQNFAKTTHHTTALFVFVKSTCLVCSFPCRKDWLCCKVNT